MLVQRSVLHPRGIAHHEVYLNFLHLPPPAEIAEDGYDDVEGIE